jgi:FkbM family methyltransferase
MVKYKDNEDRTVQYFDNFNREKVLKQFLTKDNPVVFDVGSNVGSTLDEFKEWWPNCEIHCFEPQEECFLELDKRAEKYPSNKTFINKVAVGAETKKEVYYSHKLEDLKNDLSRTTGISGFNKLNTSSSDSIALSKLNNNKEELKKFLKSMNHERLVQVIKLQDYISDQNIENIDLLKIDTQGYELEVLKGMENYLSNVNIIISELMLYDLYEKSLSFYDLEKILHKFGFKLFDISHISKNPLNGRTDWVDVVYVNENIRKKLA